jgi:hypothetical protein
LSTLSTATVTEEVQQVFYFKYLLHFLIIIGLLPVMLELQHMLKVATVASFQYPVTKTRGLNSFSVIYQNLVLKTLLLSSFFAQV